MIVGNSDKQKVGGCDTKHQSDVQSVDPLCSKVDDGRRDNNIEDYRQPGRDVPSCDLVQDRAPTYEVCNHHSDEKEKINNPTNIFASRAQQTLCHRNQIRIFWHPSANFQKEKTGAKHKQPAKDINDSSRNKTSVASSNWKCEHA